MNALIGKTAAGPSWKVARPKRYKNHPHYPPTPAARGLEVFWVPLPSAPTKLFPVTGRTGG